MLDTSGIHGFYFECRERVTMRNYLRVCILLVCMVAIGGSMALGVNAAEFTGEDGLAYLENYSENLAADENFAENIRLAIEAVRQNVEIYASIWALLPPVIAIALALITKEVYSSLFVGILSGALLYGDFHLWDMVTITFSVMVEMLSDPWNVGILIFLVILGMMVSLINRAGGSAAYGLSLIHI